MKNAAAGYGNNPFVQKNLLHHFRRLCLSGAAPLLLLPENIRIRRFNLQTEAIHDFIEEEERIMALDYDWDHNNTGYSEWSCSTCGPTRDLNSETQVFFIFLKKKKKNSGMVYFTVASEGSTAGAIKRAYIPSVDDGSNNMGASIRLDIDYITTPDGIAVDWVGRCVVDTQVSCLA